LWIFDGGLKTFNTLLALQTGLVSLEMKRSQ
jgi:hypothetical protein